MGKVRSAFGPSGDISYNLIEGDLTIKQIAERFEQVEKGLWDKSTMEAYKQYKGYPLERDKAYLFLGEWFSWSQSYNGAKYWLDKQTKLVLYERNIPPLENTAPICSHEFINVSFADIKLVCKHCDKEK